MGRPYRDFFWYHLKTSEVAVISVYELILLHLHISKWLRKSEVDLFCAFSAVAANSVCELISFPKQKIHYHDVSVTVVDMDYYPGCEFRLIITYCFPTPYLSSLIIRSSSYILIYQYSSLSIGARSGSNGFFSFTGSIESRSTLFKNEERYLLKTSSKEPSAIAAFRPASRRLESAKPSLFFCVKK